MLTNYQFIAWLETRRAGPRNSCEWTREIFEENEPAAETKKKHTHTSPSAWRSVPEETTQRLHCEQVLRYFVPKCVLHVGCNCNRRLRCTFGWSSSIAVKLFLACLLATT